MHSHAESKPKNTLVKTPIKVMLDDDTVKFNAYEINTDFTSEIYPSLDNTFFCIGKDGIIRKMNFESCEIVAESKPIPSLVRSAIRPKLISLPNNVTMLYGPMLSTTILLNSTNLKHIISTHHRFREVNPLTSNMIIAKTYPSSKKMSELDQAEVFTIDETCKSIGKVSLKIDQEWTTLKNLLIKVDANTLIFNLRLSTGDFVETAKLKIAGFGLFTSSFIYKLQSYPDDNLISFVMSTHNGYQQKAVIVDVTDLQNPRILREFKQAYDIQRLPYCPAFLLQEKGDTTHGEGLGNKSMVWDRQRNELHPVPYVNLGVRMISRSPATGSLAYVTNNSSKINFLHSITIQPQLKKQTLLTSLSIMKEKKEFKEVAVQPGYEASDSESFRYL